MWCLKKITLLRRFYGSSGNGGGPGLFAYRPYLSAKCGSAGFRLGLELKLEAACDGRLIGAASKDIRFKTLAVQPFPDAGHDCGQLLALALKLNHVQHARALLPALLALS
jgi:hypothetical protein